MEQSIEKISGSKLKVTIKLNTEETATYEARALAHLGAEHNFKGFRPGKVPAEIVRAQLGADTINHEAMLAAIREIYPKLIKEQNWETIGQPQADIIAASPLVFTVEVAILPEVNLGKWENIKIERQVVSVKDGEVDNLINEIKDSRASESAVTRPAQISDKVDIDFEILVDKVLVEGGRQLHYQAVLGKGQLIPGFEDNIVGLAAGQEKNFNITFPQNYQAKLAGREAQVKLKLNQVFVRSLPELNDAWVASLGAFKTVTELKGKLTENLLAEYQAREEERVERAMFEAMLQVASFSDLPEILINQELDSMVHELSHSIEQQGLSWPDYLTHLKKDEAALKKEFKLPAEKRVKLALLTRAVARAQNFAIEDSTIEAELAPLLAQYTNDSQALGYLQGDDYRAYLKSRLLNQRVIEWLKQRLVK
ncbi:MAG: trigger factor [Candidatus Kerfeldbacteria bacterium]|nr:trigger factor [Candidatus Kerfeldbacteria bacterium]